MAISSAVKCPKLLALANVTIRPMLIVLGLLKAAEIVAGNDEPRATKPERVPET